MEKKESGRRREEKRNEKVKRKRENIGGEERIEREGKIRERKKR